MVSLPADKADLLIKVWLTEKNAYATRAEYAKDLGCFARFLHADGPADAARWLLDADGLTAYAKALDYRDACRAHLAAATTNRRLASLRSLATCAFRQRLIAYSLPVPNLPQANVRRTTGPGRDTICRMIRLAQADPKTGPRDLAIVLLLYLMGLRRAEIVALTRDDYRVRSSRRLLYLRRKGLSDDAQPRELPREAAEALTRWLAIRSDDCFAMFPTASRSHMGDALTANGLWRIVHRMGAAAGDEHVTPHGIRHTAATDAVGIGMTLRQAQNFLGHKNLASTQRYLDQIADDALDVGLALSDSLRNMI